MKYLKKFNTEEEYNAFLDSEEYADPNVSLIGSVILKYNPIRVPLYIEALEDLTVAKSGSATFYYSTDLFNWNNLGTAVSVQKGDKIYFKSTASGSRSSGIGTFTISGKCNIGGNILSMNHGDDYINGKNNINSNQFARLFAYCTTIINAKDLILPVTTLSGGCYDSMFMGCSSLITAPKLPALYVPTYATQSYSHGAYASMFQDCTSLIEAPELPAETIEASAYSNMFQGCTSLKKAPAINVKTLVNGPITNVIRSGTYHMAYMFKNCVNLTDGPESLLPTTLLDRCYYSMFENCTSLKAAPRILAQTLATSCCYRMFYGCTSLESAAELSAKTLIYECYDNMFYNCTSLRYIKAMFTTNPSSSYTEDWVKNVSSAGTFVKNINATWTTTGSSGKPSNWAIKYFDPDTDKYVIKFTINGTSCVAEEGSTWADWIASTYNTAGFTISDTSILSADGGVVVLNNVAVVSTDVITSNKAYTIQV